MHTSPEFPNVCDDDLYSVDHPSALFLDGLTIWRKHGLEMNCKS